MVNTQRKKMALIVALFIAGILIMEAFFGHQILVRKATDQDVVSESLQRWKTSYMALADSRLQWDKNYRRESSVQDTASLFAYLGLANYGLTSDPDNIILTKVEQVTSNSAAIGLTKICMANGTGDGGALVVEASNYQTLLLGVEKLAKRPDIFLGNISVQGDKLVPIAKLGDFCILLRND